MTSSQDPHPVYDSEKKNWTVEFPGSIERPELRFPSQEEAQKWCDNAIKAWEN